MAQVTPGAVGHKLVVPSMIAGSVATCVVALVATGFGAVPELLVGMAGPLSSAVLTWQVLERTHASAPERLTGVMITAFGIKVLFFALYVVAALWGLGLRPKAFMLSFTGYYVGLHIVEALCLRRLLAGAGSSASAGSRL